MIPTIELFREERLDDCADLFAAVFGAEPWNEPWTPETARARLSEILDTPTSLGLVSLADGEATGLVLGCLWQQAEGRLFHLYEMCVRPDLQRGGIGRALLDRLDEELEDEGAARSFLLTFGGSSAEAFYRESGYRRSPHTVALVKDLPPR